MDNKIQELTDKIFHEGVEKGNAEKQRIIEKAQEEAQSILAEARKKADDMINTASKTAEDISSHAKSELALYASQTVDSLKTEVTNLITDQIVREEVDSFVSSSDYFNQFIVSLAQKWSTTEPICISTSDAESLRKHFVAKAKDLLDDKVSIKQVNGINTAFSISPADGSYKIDFGKDEFMNFFKEFLRPQLFDLLFK